MGPLMGSRSGLGKALKGGVAVIGRADRDSDYMTVWLGSRPDEDVSEQYKHLVCKVALNCWHRCSVAGGAFRSRKPQVQLLVESVEAASS